MPGRAPTGAAAWDHLAEHTLARVQLGGAGAHRKRRGVEVVLPWGDPDDRLRAERIIKDAGVGGLLPRQGLTGLARTLAAASGVVGVDSGMTQLAAAVGTPAVTLNGPTRTELTGATGLWQLNLAADFACAPCMRRDCDYRGRSAVEPACFEAMSPERVFAELIGQIGGAADEAAS